MWLERVCGLDGMGSEDDSQQFEFKGFYLSKAIDKLAGESRAGYVLITILVSVIPAVVCVPIAAKIARSNLKEIEKFHVALEQVLDKLEHGEIDLKPKQIGPGEGGIGRIADEIRKNLGI